MQQIERYGVIALVFLLVTIVAVSFWGDSKSPGFWSRLTGKSDGKKEVVAEKTIEPGALVTDHVADANLPLTSAPTTANAAPTSVPSVVDGNTTSVTDMPVAGNGSMVVPNGAAPLAGNPFMPGTPNAGLAPTNVPAGIVNAPVAPVTPTASNDYVVRSGDSLALIARRQLGAENRWPEIQAANPGLDPKRLAPGMTLHMPTGAPAVANVANTQKPVAAANKSTTKSAPKATVAKQPAADTKKVAAASKSTSTYTIKKGDLLRSIAREKLGDESRWKDIVAVNPGLDPQKLAVGQQIKLPTSESRRPVSAATVASAGKPTVR